LLVLELMPSMALALRAALLLKMAILPSCHRAEGRAPEGRQGALFAVQKQDQEVWTANVAVLACRIEAYADIAPDRKPV